MRNMNKQHRLYSQGFEPIVCNHDPFDVTAQDKQWVRGCTDVKYEIFGEDFFLYFTYTFSATHKPTSTTYFAFCYPFSYSDSQEKLLKLDRLYGVTDTESGVASIYYHREILTHSLDGLNVDLVTVRYITNM